MPCGFLVAATINAVGTLMVDFLVKPVERRLRYLLCFNNIVQELQEQENNLTAVQTQVQRKVNDAKLQPQTQVIHELVENWLKDAENVLNDMEGLNSRIQENKRCFRWCPHWIWRLSKDIEQKTKAIGELVKRSFKFDSIGLGSVTVHRSPCSSPGIEFFSSKDFIASESSISAINKIMDALKTDGVNMIGVWGIGGVGKTTLVKEVGKKVKEFRLFEVVLVAVSQNPNIGKIQEKIADFINLKFRKVTNEGKAEELRLRLEKEEKILIILDDMWKELDLKQIGIPVAENSKVCRIIFTTRRRQVCGYMASQLMVPLGGLNGDEAWNLFKMKASLDEEKANKETIKLAMEVAGECKGLPVAIVTLARALKGYKTAKGWEIALKKLRSSRLMEIKNIKEEEKNAYMCLKISYDYVKDDTTKRCFLLCALFPEDHSIDVEEELVRCAWGLELYRDATSIEDVRVEVVEAIDYLKDSCLLLEDGERCIKVHDVICDVALWMAFEADNGLVIKPGLGPENENFKEKLDILLLNKHDCTTIEYFEGMRKLKVLSLKIRYRLNGSFFSLNALKSLTNLRALHLINSETCSGFVQLEDMSPLANLAKLEILSLHGLMLKESMDVLGEFRSLRVLGLCRCKFFSVFGPHLIQRLVQLEELYLDNESISNAILPALSFLPRLTSLWLKPSHFPKGFVFPRLERYTIEIFNSFWTYFNGIVSSRSLRISWDFPLNVYHKLFSKVEFLEVAMIRKTILIDGTPWNESVATLLQNLKYAKISFSENLQVIFQIEKAENHEVVLSKLKCLWLNRLHHLEYIWKMPTQHVSLVRLETIEFSHCGMLKSLFSFSLAQSLARLEKLVVKWCHKLEQIVKYLGGDEQQISLEKFLCLPKLRSLKIERCDNLEYIFPHLMAPQGLQQLQELRMERLPRLKQICKAANFEKVENGIQLSQHQLLLSLTYLEVSHCPELSDSSVYLKPVKTYL